MTKIHHLNCVKMVWPYNENVSGHCLLLENDKKLVLVDTGIGLLDTLHPLERIGQAHIESTGLCLVEEITAIRQIKKLGFDPGSVKHCVISHLDFDHIGGLADFPNACVHVSEEEYQNFQSGNSRYLPIPMAHTPNVITYPVSNDTWFGLEARKIHIDFDIEMYFIPLFGHTLGHCGVAIKLEKDKWLFYAGDAYMLSVELSNPNHPVNKVLELTAQDNQLRIESLNKIRKLLNEYNNIELYCFHDFDEFIRFK